MAKTLAIVSGKGGVGKTTVAINLGLALNNFGRRILVVDADILKPNLGLRLGLRHNKLKSHSIHSAIEENKTLDEVVYIHSSGLKLVPGDSSIIPRPVVIAKKVFDDIRSSELVILDSPPGFGSVMGDVLKIADALIVVVTPDPVAVQDGLRTLRMAQKQQLNVLGIIVNRYIPGESELSPEDIFKITGINVLAVIPESHDVHEAAKLRTPTSHINPDSEFSEGFKKLAAGLLGQEYVSSLEKEEQKSLFSQLLEKLGLKNG